MTWVELPPGTDFPLENLPFGIVRPRDLEARVGVRIGDAVLDLVAAGIEPDLTARPSLNALLASGRLGAIRSRVGELLASDDERPDWLHRVDDVHVLMPIDVVDFVDFYSSLHHAANVGRILRPDAEPLSPNWRYLPVAYHGRARTVVASGTPVVRPAGLVVEHGHEPVLAPTRMLDFELEVGFVVGGPPASMIEPDHADRHVCGAVLLNDWSARDIQAFEYRPLGPHLAKSFATTISPWVVTLDALRPYLVEPPEQEPPPDPYLRAALPWALDLELRVELNGTEVAATNFSHMYWTFAQQLAHLTVNGAATGAGDLYGSGTVSGPTRGECGSLIELTRRGAEPVTLADGSARGFLDDGDTVTLKGWCGPKGPPLDSTDVPRIGFGQATGTIVPTPERPTVRG